MNITLPTIHTNGTSPEMLLAGYREAFDRVRDAIKAFEKIEFNARDYYPQGAAVWAKAREEQHDRTASLQKIESELLSLATHCKDAIKERRRQTAPVQCSTPINDSDRQAFETVEGAL